MSAELEDMDREFDYLLMDQSSLCATVSRAIKKDEDMNGIECHIARPDPNIVSLRDKLGFLGLTTDVTKKFSQVLEGVQNGDGKVSWVAHSQGGAIFSEAVRYNGGELSKNSVEFHAGANNIWMTNSILDKANINEQHRNQVTRYLNSPIDFVPNVIGLNGNLLEILASTIAFPLLFSSLVSDDLTISPHTPPYNPASTSKYMQGVAP